MPYQRGRMEPDLEAGVEHPPTQVDVVACGIVDRVEPAHGGKCLAPEGHVAARYVLGAVVSDEDVHRPAGRARHLLRADGVVRRRNVRTTGAPELTGLEPEREVV